MRCLSCDNEFIVKRKIKDLFKNNKYFICDRCVKEHSLNINYTSVPLDKGYKLDIVSLLDENEKMNHNAYILEYSKIVNKYINENIILYDNFKINSDNIKKMNILSKLVEKDILIVSFRCRI